MVLHKVFQESLNDLPDPQICIVFNGGAAGDFFASLLSQQILACDNLLELDSNGAVVEPVGQTFKMSAKKFYETGFSPACFFGIKNEPIVSTHYCYQQLLDLFPKCQFYYIDDSSYIDITVEVYIKKRVPSLRDWLQHRLKSTDNKLNKKLTHEQIKDIMKNDWSKQSDHWNKLDIQPISLYDIINQKHCLSLIESMLNIDIDVNKFFSTHNKWTNNNQDFVYKVLNDKRI